MKRDALSLVHILESIQLVLKFTKGGETEFFGSELIQSAVMRHLSIVGEATKRLTHEFRAIHQDLPWKSMAGLRDKLIHDYVKIDTREIWNVVVNDLPKLQPQLVALLRALGHDDAADMLRK